MAGGKAVALHVRGGLKLADVPRPPLPPLPPYKCSPLAASVPAWLALDDERRGDMLERAERLHDELDAAGVYPFAFIAFRLTGFRRDHGDDSLLVGEALLADLRTLIDQLSRDAGPARGRPATR